MGEAVGTIPRHAEIAALPRTGRSRARLPMPRRIACFGAATGLICALPRHCPTEAICWTLWRNGSRIRIICARYFATIPGRYTDWTIVNQMVAPTNDTKEGEPVIYNLNYPKGLNGVFDELRKTFPLIRITSSSQSCRMRKRANYSNVF